MAGETVRRLLENVPLDHVCHERTRCLACEWLAERDAALPALLDVVAALEEAEPLLDAYARLGHGPANPGDCDRGPCGVLKRVRAALGSLERASSPPSATARDADGGADGS